MIESRKQSAARVVVADLDSESLDSNENLGEGPAVAVMNLRAFENAAVTNLNRLGWFWRRFK